MVHCIHMILISCTCIVSPILHTLNIELLETPNVLIFAFNFGVCVPQSISNQFNAARLQITIPSKHQHNFVNKQNRSIFIQIVDTYSKITVSVAILLSVIDDENHSEKLTKFSSPLRTHSWMPILRRKFKLCENIVRLELPWMLVNRQLLTDSAILLLCSECCGSFNNKITNIPHRNIC